MQYAFINRLDTLFVVAGVIDTIVRHALSILFWGLGRGVSLLTSRKAIRVYRAIGSALLTVVLFVVAFVQASRQPVAEPKSTLLLSASKPLITPPPVMPIALLPAAIESAPVADIANISDISINALRVLITPAFVPVALLPAAVERIEVVEAVQQPLDTLSPYELRNRCKQAGIKWRNAKPNGKHLSKREMIAALTN
jgi:hypothetical protein